MDKIRPFDWHRIFLGNENTTFFMLEIGFRVVFIYIFAVVMMRFMGKRGNKSMSVFENVLIIALGSATGDSMFYPNVPLLYACIVIVIIVGLSRLLQYLQLRIKPINTFLDGKPIILVKDGALNLEGLKSSRIREEELFGMLRTQGVSSVQNIALAIFERTGNLSIYSFDELPTKLNEEMIFDEIKAE